MQALIELYFAIFFYPSVLGRDPDFFFPFSFWPSFWLLLSGLSILKEKGLFLMQLKKFS